MSAPTLTKIEREQIEAVRAVLAPWGLAFEIQKGVGKHIKLKVAGPRAHANGVIILPCTPRNAGAAVDMARQQAARCVRDINRRLGL